MSIEELKAALDNIPKEGILNQARRLEIQKAIFEIMKAGAKK